MIIQLNQVMPEPLASIAHNADSLWGNAATLKSGSKILLNASSGKGKSTFSMTIFGVRTDYSGSITYNNRDIRSFQVDEWIHIRQSVISTVFQDLQLFKNLTVAENLLLKNGLTDFKSETEIKQLLELLEIEHKWDDPCGLLSMGQQQRVAIVRSFCQPFQWLILDEPFSHLDENNTQKSLQLINEECTKQGAGFVLTSLDDDNRFQYDYELKL
jgi:ABC-type lipoprotein export system ATPase subunit